MGNMKDKQNIIVLMNSELFDLREINDTDQQFLYEMLYQAIFVKPGNPPCDRSIIDLPEIRKYVANWGKKEDFGFIGVDKITDLPVGAVWLRFFPADNRGYGFISEEIPEVSIAVDHHFRGKGLGNLLLAQLLRAASLKYKTISLSVDSINPAVKLYQRFGFRKCGEEGDSMTMRYDVTK